MKNEPTNVNGLSEFNDKSRRLQSLKRYYVRIGKSATDALIKTQTVLTREISLPAPVPTFVQSYLKNQRDRKLHPRSMSDITDLIERSNEVLAKATTIFPLDPFPDTVTLDRTKLTVTTRGFLRADIMSIRIEDILNVSSYINPFFGSVTIATRVLSSDDHFTINLLPRRDAIHLKHVIQGFVIARHNNIVCDHLSREDLLETLMELGRDSKSDRYKPRTVTAPRRLLRSQTR